MRGLEPPRLAAPDPKSGVYTNFTTSACDLCSTLYLSKLKERKDGTPYTIRTCDRCLRRALLYPAELRTHTLKNGAPDRIRTYNRRIRSPKLYPVEPRTLLYFIIVIKFLYLYYGVEYGIRTHGPQCHKLVL